MSSKEAKIFISYSRADSDFALKLGKDLRSAANIWIDQLDVSVSERWDRAVEAALESCDSFWVILSPNSVVRNKISYALEENKRFFPVLYMICKIPLGIRRIQRSDFRDSYETGLKELFAAFKLSLPEEDLKKTPSKVEPPQKRTTVSPANVSPGSASPEIKLNLSEKRCEGGNGEILRH